METNPDHNIGTPAGDDGTGKLEAYWMGGRLIVVRFSPPGESAGPGITESWLRGGQGPETICHRHADSLTYLLSGNITYKVDDKISVLAPGDVISTPRGSAYAYRVDSDDGARILTITTPGYVWIDYVRAIGIPAAELTLPPASFQPLDMAIVRRLATANGFAFVGPRLPGAGREGKKTT